MRRRHRRAAAALLLAMAADVLLCGAGRATDPKTALPWASGYQPQGVDERGLWMQMDEAERELRNSNFVVRDPNLNAYVKGVLCRTVGDDRCASVRIYVIRTPQFNANMAPNGMMQVWTGLLLRMRNEAQLAAVLGHEFGHFEQRHSLRLFHDVRAKTDAMAWLSFLPYGVGLLAQAGMAGSIFNFSRDMEREADVASVDFMVKARYAPSAASTIWSQIRDEQDATAAARKQRSRKDRGGGFFDSHPSTAERVENLARIAASAPKDASTTGEAEYRRAMADWWAPLIDDQIKLNDFGGTEFLLEKSAASGWTSELLYARGELYRARGKEGDFAKAAQFYREAIASGTTPPEARRGLGLALLRTGAADEGRQLIKDYLRLKPGAPDRPMMIMLAGGE